MASALQSAAKELPKAELERAFECASTRRNRRRLELPAAPAMPWDRVAAAVTQSWPRAWERATPCRPQGSDLNAADSKPAKRSRPRSATQRSRPASVENCKVIRFRLALGDMLCLF